jgi:2,3-bisphosphoglycerate-independent phosphoglycerate mutase
MKRTHTAEPVPFLISGTGIGAGGFLGFSEQDAAASEVYFERGWELIEYLFKGAR